MVESVLEADFRKHLGRPLATLANRYRSVIHQRKFDGFQSCGPIQEFEGLDVGECGLEAYPEFTQARN